MEVLGYTRDAGFADAQIFQTSVLQPSFKMIAVKDAAASEAAGYEQKVDRPHIVLKMDNGMTEIVDEVVDNPPCPERDWKHRFPIHWKMFEQGVSEAVIGTPLAELFVNAPSKVEYYKRFSVYTVEQLAQTSDVNVQGMGLGAMQDREDAKAFIEAKKEGAVYAALAKEKEALQSQLEDMKLTSSAQAKELEELKAQMSFLLKAAKREEGEGTGKRVSAKA